MGTNGRGMSPSQEPASDPPQGHKCPSLEVSASHIQYDTVAGGTVAVTLCWQPAPATEERGVKTQHRDHLRTTPAPRTVTFLCQGRCSCPCSPGAAQGR